VGGRREGHINRTGRLLGTLQGLERLKGKEGVRQRDKRSNKSLFKSKTIRRTSIFRKNGTFLFAGRPKEIASFQIQKRWGQKRDPQSPRITEKRRKGRGGTTPQEDREGSREQRVGQKKKACWDGEGGKHESSLKMQKERNSIIKHGG